MELTDCLRSQRRRRSLLTAVGMLMPNFLGFVVFTVGPVFFSLAMSFTDWNLARHTAGTVPIRFVGLKNYAKLLWFSRDPMGPPARHPYAWAVGFALLLAAFICSLYAVWRTCRRGPRENNPPGRFFIALLAGYAGVVSLGTTAWLGTWTAHPRLGVGWPAAKLVFAGLCIGSCVRRLRVDHTGAGRARLLRLCAALLALAVCLRLLAPIGRQTFTIWTPNTRLFWFYLSNTAFLMLGIPVSIAGSLCMALILFRTLEVAGWRRRLAIAGTVLTVGSAASWGLWTCGAGVSPEHIALLLGISGIAAVGILGGTTAFRTLFYLPSVGMGVATYILWQKMFNPDTGPLNTVLSALFDTPPFQLLESFVRWWNPALTGWELSAPDWLQSVTWAKPALMLMGIWGAVGSNNMLLYLAGLSNVPGELYEAADMDGASRWQRFWNVTWPQLAPTTFFIVVMSCIHGLQGGFEQARIMTQGGPARSTTTISYYLYTEAFELNNMAFGCAIAWTLFLMVFLLTAINWRFGNQIVAEYQ